MGLFVLSDDSNSKGMCYSAAWLGGSVHAHLLTPALSAVSVNFTTCLERGEFMGLTEGTGGKMVRTAW